MHIHLIKTNLIAKLCWRLMLKVSMFNAHVVVIVVFHKCKIFTTSYLYYKFLLHVVLLLMQKLDNTLIVCECCLHVCNTNSLNIHYLITLLMFSIGLSYHYAKVWSLKPFICLLQESQLGLTYVTRCKLIRRSYIDHLPTYIWMDDHLSSKETLL